MSMKKRKVSDIQSVIMTVLSSFFDDGNYVYIYGVIALQSI